MSILLHVFKLKWSWNAVSHTHTQETDWRFNILIWTTNSYWQEHVCVLLIIDDWSLSSPGQQHLPDVVFGFFHAAFKVHLFLLEITQCIVTPPNTLPFPVCMSVCILLCICTSSSLIFSSAVFCLSVSWLLISSFDWRMNLKHTHRNLCDTPEWCWHTCLVLIH